MTSAQLSHPLRAARPLNLAGTRTRLRNSQPNRLSLYDSRQSKTRSFSIAPAALAVVQTTQDAIISIHSVTHIPWFLVIPCVAVGINLVFRLPSTAYTHKIQHRQSKLSLVLQGWGWRVLRDVQKEGIPPARQEKEAMKRYKKVISRVHRSMGLQQWKLYSSVFTLPFWLVGIESVRRLCGGPRGILGAFLTGRAEDTPAEASIPQQPHSTASPVDITEEATGQLADIDTTISPIVLPDPSITVEGCLWFQDLSAADPYHILPLLLSVTLVANMLPATSAGLRQLFGLTSGNDSTLVTPAAQRQLRFRRGLLLVGALVGPITADLPAALHLYWLSSSATLWATSRILRHFMPLETKAVKRCKGAEANVIRPRRSETASLQAEQPKKT
ncbi:hypothetical protein M426DRAFT_6967 [Hypoxylon sp. CI-4A]|nr:hypothetical protein M426DRAFT_6967 [Hypoxylon sp. CI-4A]